ncbi:carboxymuconolactone decarboxylase family protein [Opitutus terrae]|uniref:Alkylhydroperoxidase like protein, AhpD family n=1 Tax=Opitutus terrae (strain DSM 11246 / JCM 15787 / PB90-1) TaxID=452637 RepID=B1ZZL0_OPITP|nr:carboxymuconolactone decarboxylase family protein [Opitutus terrae]ACB76413.1 alkylhydroperoxidase like protein, AhpD family [Opitutus terrae PB90-1]
MITTSLETRNTEPRLNYAKAAPGTLQSMLLLQQAVDQSGLEASLLRLIEMRVSQINGCAFCLDMHFREAKAAGESDERLYLLDAWHEVDLYTPRERAALRWAEVLTRLSAAAPDDDDFAAARDQFSEAELSHLTLAIVVINGWNRFNVGFRTPPGFAG